MCVLVELIPPCTQAYIGPSGRQNEPDLLVVMLNEVIAEVVVRQADIVRDYKSATGLTDPLSQTTQSRRPMVISK